MDLATKLIELEKRTAQHRELLLTEEAAKTALVMPFLQALGYDVFDPGEVIPEFTADVGIKKSEKVDYALCVDGRVSILIECKPSSVALDLKHASQLYRYLFHDRSAGGRADQRCGLPILFRYRTSQSDGRQAVLRVFAGRDKT